jgi:thiosulfate/3-mercaptopyruvate sulfurtransferase
MSARSQRAQYFVDASELRELLGGSTPPVLLDVRNENGVPDGRPEYETGHLPNAVYVDLPSELIGQRHEGSGAGPLPEVADLQVRARAWGISEGDSVVVYDNVFGTKAGRAWLVLRWAGVEDVRILNGGYAAWLAAGYEVSTQEPLVSPGDVRLSPHHLSVLDDDGAAKAAEVGVLLDARSGEQFRGSLVDGRREGGHIPGAVSAPARDNLDERGLLFDEEELRKRFDVVGADGSQSIGVYCGSGVAAAHELAVLSSLGLVASIYVGSFTAWSSDPVRPVTTGP